MPCAGRPRATLLLLAVLLAVTACQQGGQRGTSSTPANRAASDEHAPAPAESISPAKIKPDTQSPRELGEPQGVEHLLALEAVDLYRLDLGPGIFVELVAEQLGADVELVLTTPDGGTVLADGLTNAVGPEHLAWVTEVPGEYQVVVRRIDHDTVEGSYTLRVAARRDVTQADRRRVEAMAALRTALDPSRATGDVSRFPRRADAFRAALAAWELAGDPVQEARVLFRLGYHQQQDRRDPAAALEAYAEALERLPEGQAPALAVSLLHQIGWSHYRSNAWEDALRFFHRALPLHVELGDLRGEASTCNNLGLIYARLGELQDALVFYRRALTLSRRLGDSSHAARVLHNRGHAYNWLGDTTLALDDLRAALEIRQEHGWVRSQAATWNAIAQIHQNSGDLALAIETFRRSLALREASEDRRGQAVTLVDLGSAYEANTPEQAEELYLSALEVFRELGDIFAEGLVRIALGRLHAQENNLDTAFDHYLAARQIFRELGSPSQEARTLLGLGRIEHRRKHWDTAEAYLSGALENVEELRARPASEELRATFFASQQGYYESYIALRMDLHRQDPGAGHAMAALEVSERARGRTLLELLTSSGAGRRGGNNPQLRARERELSRELHRKDGERRCLLASPSPDAERLATLEREILEIWRELTLVLGELRLDEARPRAAEPLSVEAIQRQALDDDTLLLEYELGEDASYLWAVDTTSLSAHVLPPQAEIEEMARLAYHRMSRNRRLHRGLTDKALRELGDVLIGPIADRLAGYERLLVISDGVLHYLPFAALKLDMAYLGETHEILHMPSASTAAVSRRRGRHARGEGIAMIADPVLHPGDPRLEISPSQAAPSSCGGSGPAASPRFERLLFADNEARSILGHLPKGTRRLVAQGFDANRETLLSGDLSHYRYVHLATHGLLNTDHPALSGLALASFDRQGRAQPGFLYPHEIYGLELNAELVTLSACQTALGREIRGEGLVGLTQAFLDAGARQVLVSLWSVNDQATATLMERFYHHLLVEDLSPSAALRAAQADLRRTQRWRDPYEWAAFVLIGA